MTKENLRCLGSGTYVIYRERERVNERERERGGGGADRQTDGQANR